MRKIPRAQLYALTIMLFGGIAINPAIADSNYYSNSQVGLNLPPIAVPYGQDEVRAMDGTYCRSSVANKGAYMDMGVVGNGGYEDVPGTGAVYGRLILPLGKQPKRIDCTALYDLEIQRLRLELQLMRMGVTAATAPAPSAEWQNSGWTTKGRVSGNR